MKPKHLYKILFSIAAFVAITSCQKVVVLDLNTADPMIVIEGNITANQGPQTVYVTTSGSFYTAEGIGPVDDATVIIKDNTGSDTLDMYAPGIYYTYNISGRENVEYSIEVIHDGVVYEGTELFPEKKTIDSLSYLVNEGIFGDGGLNEDGDTTYNIICRFQDPDESFDYYRFVVHLNDSLVQTGFRKYAVIDDELFGGQLFDYEITGTGATKGDTISVELQSTGYHTYTYFNTLNDALSGGMGSTPYNPISNLTNEALGYFGAYSSDEQVIIIK